MRLNPLPGEIWKIQSKETTIWKIISLGNSSMDAPLAECLFTTIRFGNIEVGLKCEINILSHPTGWNKVENLESLKAELL